MKDTTLCYIEHEGKYLMLYRNKKENDLNAGKWIGVGGKFLPGESADECLLREVKEETGLTLLSYAYRGVVYFHSDTWESEKMHLFTSDSFEGELIECSEGELHWIEKENIPSLSLWEGDMEIFKCLESSNGFFELSLHYKGDKLYYVD